MSLSDDGLYEQPVCTCCLEPVPNVFEPGGRCAPCLTVLASEVADLLQQDIANEESTAEQTLSVMTTQEHVVALNRLVQYVGDDIAAFEAWLKREG